MALLLFRDGTRIGEDGGGGGVEMFGDPVEIAFGVD